MAYVTSATTKGGRNGRAMLDNGALALAMALPKEIGGAGDGPQSRAAVRAGLVVLLRPGDHARSGEEIRPRRSGRAGDLRSHAGSTRTAASALAAELKVAMPGADKDKLPALVEEAHTVCPYSKATKGNMPVKLTVV